MQKFVNAGLVRPCQLVELRVALNDQGLGHLTVLLKVGTLAHCFVKSTTCLSEVSLHVGLVFLTFGLVLVKNVNLFAHFSHVVVVFLTKRRQGTLVGNAHFFKIGLQLQNFRFSGR